MQVRIQQRFAHLERVAWHGQTEGMLHIVGQDKALLRQRDGLHKGCIHQQVAPEADKRRYTIRIQGRELPYKTRNPHTDNLLCTTNVNGSSLVAFGTKIGNLRQIEDGEFITGIEA